MLFTTQSFLVTASMFVSLLQAYSTLRNDPQPTRHQQKLLRRHIDSNKFSPFDSPLHLATRVALATIRGRQPKQAQHKRQHQQRSLDSTDAELDDRMSSSSPASPTSSTTTDLPLGARSAAALTMATSAQLTDALAKSHLRATKSSTRSTLGDKSTQAAASGKSLGAVSAPALDAIAIRLVSAAASTQVARSLSSPSSLSASINQITAHPSSSQASGGGGSLLAQLSHALLSSAVTQLVNLTSPPSASHTSSLSHSSAHGQQWPPKLTPIIHSLATSVSGLLDSAQHQHQQHATSGANIDELDNSHHTHHSGNQQQASAGSSLLASAADLLSAASSQVSQAAAPLRPLIASPSSSSSSSSSPPSSTALRPHNPKHHHNSPAMSGIMNLARYVLCKYIDD